MAHYISSVTDLANFVANNPIGDVTEAERAAMIEALRAADHPAWGDDWSEWLDKCATEIMYAAIGAEGAPGVEASALVVVRETHSIGYRCDAEIDAAEIDAAVRAQLAPAEIAAWQAACDAGRGPAADADVSGVRWVVTDEDWPSAVTYTITATNGAYLRESMRTATAETVDDVLASAAAYIGAEGEIERQDGGDIVLGPLVARPVREEA